MSVPSMVSPNVLSRINSDLARMNRRLDEIASTFRTLESTTIGSGGLTLKNSGAVMMLDELDRLVTSISDSVVDLIDPDTNGRMRLNRGRILLWDDYDSNPNGPGLIATDQGAGINYMRLFPPFTSGDGRQNSLTMQGRTPGENGMVWVYSDGGILLRVQSAAGTRQGSISLSADTISLDADRVPIFGLPTTSGGYLLRYNQVGDDWTMALDSSSRRYKDQITDADIDAADVLSWRVRRWKDRNQGEDAPWNVGFIAEEIDDSGTPEFVIYDDQGRPDALRYDRMVAGHQVVLQEQAERIATLEAQAAERDRQIATLAARLDALEMRDA